MIINEEGDDEKVGS